MSGEGLRYEPFSRERRSIARRFRCGEEDLDIYLRTRAHLDQEQGLAAIRILYDPERNRIAGYFTLSGCEIERELLPEELTEGKTRYARYPATLLGRLARDLNYPSLGLGKRLLFDALQRAVAATDVVGSFALVVDAKTPAAEGFYTQYGFLPLSVEGGRPRLFVPMATIRQLFAE